MARPILILVFYLDIAQNQEPNRANGSDGQRSGIYHHIFDDLKTNESVAVYVGRAHRS